MSARLLLSSALPRALLLSASALLSTQLAATPLDNGDIQALLEEHNRVRADVGVGPLQWSAEVAKVAEGWADHLGQSCSMQHSNGRLGENLFMGTAGYYGVREAARSWESEKSQYAGGPLNDSNWAPSGHYTQMVWRNTRLLGCASVTCGGQYILVCNYDPSGNYMGQSPY